MVAQVLAGDGYEVDLISHEDIGKDMLADHLGLDLGKVSLRIVPDRGEADMARISAEYDLFVNGSYMSRVKARAKRNLYLCYFPTPFDHDLSRWRRWAVRVIGPWLAGLEPGFAYGLGWFPPEGGRRRNWSWTGGDAVLELPPGGERRMAFEVGRPGAPGPVELVVRGEDGTVLARLVGSPGGFRRSEVDLPASAERYSVHLQSDTFVPGRGDDRSLGVAVSRLRLVGTERDVRLRLASRFPWLLRDPNDLSFIQCYDRILANSEYTREWIRRLWGVDSDPLFPPIRVDELHPGTKERKILTVGRFFAPGTGHCKKQLEQVEAFGRMVRRGGLDGWELHVVGGVEPGHKPYLAKVRRAAQGLPVHVHANAPRPLVNELFASSSIFWSATGYGEDEQREPWAFEHFGITTVEAMAAQCVPVVIDKAGQRETVRDGVDGYRWGTLQELESRTRELIADQALRERMARSAADRAQQFSETAFATRWHAIAASLGLPTEPS
jgi:glycosyltransferase involved in cell wall biosynthesis